MILKKSQIGFTLLEVLLSIAIVGVIGAIGAPLLISEHNRNELSIATDHLVQSLRRAKTLSQQGENDSAWGVYVASSTITIFSGDSYAGRDAAFDENLVIAGGIQVSGVDEYVFAKFTGEPSVTGTTTLESVNEDAQHVYLNSHGTVFSN